MNIVIEPAKTYRFWTTVLWTIFLLGVLVIGQYFPIVTYMLTEGMPLTPTSFVNFVEPMKYDVRLLFLSAFGGLLFVLPALWFLVKKVQNESLKEGLYLYRSSFLSYLIWFFVLILTAIGLGMLLQLIGMEKRPEFMLNLEYPTLLHKVLLLIAVVIIAPLIEELIFRGFLHKRFAGTFLGIHGAIFITAFIWAIIHIQYEAVYVFVIFFMGIIFGYARVITSSLYIPMMMHGVMNFWSIMGLFYQKGVMG